MIELRANSSTTELLNYEWDLGNPDTPWEGLTEEQRLQFAYDMGWNDGSDRMKCLWEDEKNNS